MNESNSREEAQPQPQQGEPIIRDKRRIDPVTGKLRETEPAVSDSAEAHKEQQDSMEQPEAAGDETLPEISEEDLKTLLAEAAGAETADSHDSAGAVETEAEKDKEDVDYLNDLKRVQAEYANFRRRTDREKEELTDIVTARVVVQLLPVMDDLDRADTAGDLLEGSSMQVIASKIRATFERLGVERYGKAGEIFDPAQHEAIAQLPNSEVTEETVADVVEVGYRIGGREIRAAKVAVFVPAAAAE